MNTFTMLNEYWVYAILVSVKFICVRYYYGHTSPVLYFLTPGKRMHLFRRELFTFAAILTYYVALQYLGQHSLIKVLVSSCIVQLYSA